MLLVAVSLLTLLSGISVLCGSRKGERFQATLFFLITLFAFIWAISMSIFLSLPESADPIIAKYSVLTMYITVLFMGLGLSIYPIYRYKIGKLISVLGIGACLTLLVMIIINPSLLYSAITLSTRNGNIVHLQHNLFNHLYIAYFVATCLVYIIGLLCNAYRAKTPSLKKAHLLVLIGFSITGVTCLIFDGILSFYGKYDTIWIGPLTMSFAWILHYYAILRYHLLNLSGNWLKTLSHVIIMSLAAIVYLSIFFIIFIALFKIPSPSSSVIILNIIMIVVVLLLFPVLNEVSSFIHSLTSVHEIDMVYLVKKLNALSNEYINYHELASFLSDHLHFRYVGILINNRLYGSQASKLSSIELNKIGNIKIKSDSIWAKPNDDVRQILKKNGIESIAELRDASGKPIAKLLLGKPLGNITFSNRDKNSLETAFILIEHTIETDKNRG